MRGTATVLVLLASLTPGRALAASFEPTFAVQPQTSSAGFPSNLELTLGQPDKQALPAGYSVSIPSWRFTTRIKQSSLASCSQGHVSGSQNLTGTTEAIGYATMSIATDDTRDTNIRSDDAAVLAANNQLDSQAGTPAQFKGGIWFLRWDGSAMTLCVDLTTTNGRIPVADRELLFQMTLSPGGSGAWVLGWNYAKVPGEPNGSRSITDNADLLARHVSVVSTDLRLWGRSAGNYNDVGGPPPNANCSSNCSVVFSQTPVAPGRYAFDATTAPCTDNVSGCGTPGASSTIEKVISFTDVPTGYHPAPGIASPARFSIFAPTPDADGALVTPDVTLSWEQPSIPSTEKIRGYVVIVAHPNPVPDDVGKFFVRYAVTDPDFHPYPDGTTCVPDRACNYDQTLDPCAPDFGRCTMTLHFPLRTTTGVVLKADGVFSVSIATVFSDGARSDGRCDDGTFNGTAPPCADGTSPARGAQSFGVTEFLMSPRVWPLQYVQQVNRALPPSTNTTTTTPVPRDPVDHVIVVLANLTQEKYQFIWWAPYGGITVWQNVAGDVVVGNDMAGGEILRTGSTDGLSLEMTLTTSFAKGWFARAGTKTSIRSAQDVGPAASAAATCLQSTTRVQCVPVTVSPSIQCVSAGAVGATAAPPACLLAGSTGNPI